MQTLTKINSDLQPFEQRYIQLSQGRRIHQIEKDEMVVFTESKSTGILVDLVKRTFASAGQIPNNLDLKYMVVDFYEKLNQFNRNTSIEDIKEALSLGVIHKLTTEDNPSGKYFGINVATFFDWINIYLFQKERIDSLAKKPIENKIIEKTEEEKKKIFIEAVDVACNYFHKTGIILDHGNAIYAGLVKRNLLKISDPVYNSWINYFVFDITGKLNQKANMVCTSSEDLIEKKKAIEQIEKINENSIEVISATKNELLKQFFMKLR